MGYGLSYIQGFDPPTPHNMRGRRRMTLDPDGLRLPAPGSDIFALVITIDGDRLCLSYPPANLTLHHPHFTSRLAEKSSCLRDR